MKATAGDLKKGDFILHLDDIWQVVKTEFNFQGRGQATMRTRLKSVNSQKNISHNFKTSDTVETADVEAKQMQYLYKDHSQLYFMDLGSYDQCSLPVSAIGEIVHFLREGDKYWLLLHDDKPLSMRPPASVKLKIVATEDAIAGDRVSAGKKSAKVETGATVMVPLFVKVGDMVVINPETGEYVERVKS